ncbi:MAG: hypothetical protein AAFY71_05320 [Bacteroidota bacterium]
MKYFIPFILFLLFTTSCEYATQQANNFEDPPQQELLGYEVAIEVSTDDPEDLEIFEDGVIPWISIKEPEKVWDKLEGKEEVVIKENEAILFLDYPLSKDLKLPIKADSTAGFTRGELILIISRNYKRIYAEEEASAEVKTIPLEKREGLINRNQTDGKYGIWGHDIDDLDLSGIIVHPQRKGPPVLELIIES